MANIPRRRQDQGRPDSKGSDNQQCPDQAWCSRLPPRPDPGEGGSKRTAICLNTGGTLASILNRMKANQTLRETRGSNILNRMEADQTPQETGDQHCPDQAWCSRLPPRPDPGEGGSKYTEICLNTGV